jgi:hypothetical protein
MAVLLALAGLCLFFARRDGEEPRASPVVPLEEDAPAIQIRGVNIVQGAAGLEQWRLKADSAVMGQRDGDIIAENPFLTYFVYGGEEAGAARVVKNLITVESESANIDREGNRLLFSGRVLAARGEDSLRGNLMLYDGGDRRLYCPERTAFARPGLWGDAGELVWHLEDNTLHADKGVDVDLELPGRPGDL